MEEDFNGEQHSSDEPRYIHLTKMVNAIRAEKARRRLLGIWHCGSFRKFVSPTKNKLFKQVFVAEALLASMLANTLSAGVAISCPGCCLTRSLSR